LEARVKIAKTRRVKRVKIFMVGGRYWPGEALEES
jgi:hypothetical protein